MPQLSYPYLQTNPQAPPGPVALAVITNIAKGISIPITGVVDTGADSTVLTPYLLATLNIDPTTLTKTDVGGVNGLKKEGGLVCDTLRIGLVEFPSMGLHYPNGANPVPVTFVLGCVSYLLGRKSFLNLCSVTFDGINGVTTFDF